MGITFELTGGGGGGSTSILAVANAAALPATGSEGIQLYYTQDTDSYYYWDSAAWQLLLDNSDHANLTTVIAGLAAHIANATGAHAATAISSVAAGNLAATNVGAALNELQTDIDTRALNSDLTAHINDTTDAHAGSAITNTPSGNLAATTVQGALNELQSDVDTRATAVALAAHISLATGAHAATAISYSAGGTVAATNVQTAIAEVASEADSRLTTLESSSHAAATIGNLDSTPNSKGASISGQAISVAVADATNPGVVSTATQAFGGEKNFGAGAKVGGVTLGSKEIFTVVSTAKVSIPHPVMTTAQRNAIATPPTGGTVYDSDFKQTFFYNGTNWEPERGYAVPAAITSIATTVTPSDYRKQMQQIGGSGGAVTLTDIATTNAKEGDELTYVGTDSSNTVTIIGTANVIVNGSCTLALDDQISFVFANSKWRERSRIA